MDFVLNYILPAAYSLLPESMHSPRSTAMLLAIGLQESGFRHRRQVGGGPARGYWQFEPGPSAAVHGVLRHDASRPHIGPVLSQFGYEPTVTSCYAAIEHNDILAACFARLLLFTLPDALPDKGEAGKGWDQYLAAWRPGKPKPDTWQGNFHAAWDCLG